MNSIYKKKSISSPAIAIPDNFEGYPLESFCLRGNIKSDLKNVLIPGGLIADRIERLACDIVYDIGDESFTALCVLKGGYQFFNDLLEKIRQLHRFSSSREQTRENDLQQISIEFIRVKSYEDDRSTYDLKIIGMENLSSLKDKNVLIVEDIIDTGNTMVKLVEILRGYQPRSLRVASLFVKRKYNTGYRPDFVGFDVPDKFIVGCNLDYNEYFRDLNHVCVITDEAKQKYSLKKEEKHSNNHHDMNNGK